MTEIYLDNNATTKPLPEVRAAMLEVLGTAFGNPSSAHGGGERARRALENARGSIAELVNAQEEDVVFTGSGTEANNLALFSAVTPPVGRVVTTQVEHSSILKAVEHLEEQGCEVFRLRVDRAGRLDLEELAAALTPATDLVTVQWVNNETGVVQPVGEIAELCRDRGIDLHTDAAQAVGKVPVDLAQLPITYLTCTAHKLHGPPGVGALITTKRSSLRPQLHGGPQEGGLRAGTENLPGVVGFGVAAALRRKRLELLEKRLAKLRDRFEHAVLDSLEGVSVNGNTDNRVCNSTNLLFHGTDGQALVARLDQAGIRCSQSSACTNQRPEPSYVLQAMGLTENEAYGSVRFSFSELNTEEEVDCAVEVIVNEVTTLRNLLGYEGAA